METKILLIDDEARIRRTFARNLRMAGYTVLTAEHGAAGIAQYAEVGPDLVLLDLRMPDMDGLAVLQTIRERDPEANVILISGHGEKDAVIAALRSGASDFLPKPIDNVTLESALRRAEERIHLKRKLRASQEALRQHNARLEAEVKVRTAELEREIEVRKQAHAALREREIKLRAILNATTAAVVLLDRDGIVLDANQAYVARFGLTLEALVGRCVWDLFPSDVTAYRKDRLAEVFTSGEPVRAVDKREGM